MAYPTISVTEYMFKYLDEFSDRTAFVEVDTQRSMTYKELKVQIIKAAHGFKSLGIKHGDVVCIYSPNNIEYAITFFSLCALGAVLQNTNPLYTVGELKAQLELCETDYIITVPPLLEKVKESRTSSVKEVIVIGPTADGCVTFDSLMKTGSGGSLPEVAFDTKTTVAVYLFSSGTTGLPKAVQLSQYNIVANLVQLKTVSGPMSEKCLVFLPFFHLYGLLGILASALTYGTELVLMSRFLPIPFMAAIEKYKITVVHLVPPIMVLLAKMPETSNYNLTSVQKALCGAAPLSTDIENRVKQIFGIEYIGQGFGMTEVMITHLDTIEAHKFGSVGKPVQGIQQKVIDITTGEDLGPNQDGEVCVKGEQCMMGYLKRPEATKEILLEDGWMKTGDVGHIDDDGYLFIVDRIKELIKYKGHQVAPAELENLILKHPGIADVGVIGVPDLEAGELPKAFVVGKKGVQVTPEEIEAWVRERAAPHKRLRGGVEFIDQIPKSASGKILRRVLKDRK